MATLPGLSFDLAANVARFATDMEEASKIATRTAGKIEKTFEHLTSSMEGVIAAFAFEKILDEAGKAEKAFAALENAVQATGGAAGYSAKQLSEMAESLEKVSNFDDDVIKDAESMLLNFTKIGHDVFPQAMKAAMDLATKLGVDLHTAALQLGKALQDPVNGMTGLRKAGVMFSDAQKDMIKNMVATGHQAQAQQYILDQLAHTMGGAAEAARNTLGGSVDALHRSFDDLLKAIGLSQSDGLQAAFNSMTNLMDEAAKHAKLISDALLGIAAGALINSLALVPKAITDIIVALKAAGVAVSTFEGIATLGLATIVAAMITLKDQTLELGGFQVTLQNLFIAGWEQAQQVFQTFAGLFSSWGAELQVMLMQAEKGWEKYFATAVMVFHAIGDAAIKVGQILANVFSNTQYGKDLKATFDDSKKWLDQLAANYGAGVDVIKKRAAELTEAQKKAEEGRGSALPHGSTFGDDASGGASKKAADAFAKWKADEAEKIKYLQTELSLGKEAAEQEKIRAELQAKFGSLYKQNADFIEKQLKQELALQHDNDYKNEIDKLKQKLKLDQDMVGQTEQEAAIRREIASIETAMPFLTDKQKKSIEELVRAGQKALDVEKQRQAIKADQAAIAKEDQKLADDLRKQIEMVTLGKERADIEQKMREFIEQHPSITEQEVDLHRQRLEAQKQEADIIKSVDYADKLKQETADLESQLQIKRLIQQGDQKGADLLKAKLDYEKQTKLAINDQVRAMLEANVAHKEYIQDAEKALDIAKQQEGEWAKYRDGIKDLDRLWSEGLLTLQQYQKAAANINPIFKQFKTVADSVGSSFSSALSDWIVKGQKFSDVMKNLGKQLLSTVLQQAIFTPLANGISSQLQGLFSRLFHPSGPSGGGSGLVPPLSTTGIPQSTTGNGMFPGQNIPGFASGGRPIPGGLSLVGENGPELFVPDAAGTILPNDILKNLDSTDRSMLNGFYTMFGALGMMGMGGFGGGMSMPTAPRGMAVGSVAGSGSAGGGDTYYDRAMKKADQVNQLANNYDEQMQGGWGGAMQLGLQQQAKMWQYYGSLNGGHGGFGVAPRILADDLNRYYPVMNMVGVAPEGGDGTLSGYDVGRDHYTWTGADMETWFRKQGYNGPFGSPLGSYNGGVDMGPQTQGYVPGRGPGTYSDAGNWIPNTNPAVARINFGPVNQDFVPTTGMPGIPYGSGPQGGVWPGELGTVAAQMWRMRGVLQMNGFANGGDPPVGLPSIVGERGPELFVPKTKGTVLPNNLLGALGGGGNVEVHNHPAPGTRIETHVDNSGPVPKLSNIVVQEVARSLNTRGPAAQLFSRSFGVRRQTVGR